jgi:hypothetical protein
LIIYLSSVFFGKYFHGISKIEKSEEVKYQIVKGSRRKDKFLRSSTSCNNKGENIRNLQQEGSGNLRVASRRAWTSASCSKKGKDIDELQQEGHRHMWVAKRREPTSTSCNKKGAIIHELEQEWCRQP